MVRKHVDLSYIVNRRDNYVLIYMILALRKFQSSMRLTLVRSDMADQHSFHSGQVEA